MVAGFFQSSFKQVMDIFRNRQGSGQADAKNRNAHHGQCPAFHLFSSPVLTDIPRIPDSGVIFRLIEARGNEIRLQPTPLAAKRRIARLAMPEPVAFPRSRRTSAVVVRRI